MTTARRWLGWFGFWTVLGLVFAGQLYLAGLRSAAPATAWSEALRTQLPYWYLWGALVPLVRHLARRVRIDRANWDRSVIIHFSAGLWLCTLHLLGTTALQGALRGGQPYPFLANLIDNVATSYHWNLLIYASIVAVVHALDYHRDAEVRHARAVELEAQLRALIGGPSGAEGGGARPRYSDRLLVADDGRSFFLRTADVHWLEAARNYVRVHAGDCVHILRTTLVSLEGRLDPERFRRISRSVIVNLDRVREVQPWFHGDAVVILESGTRLPLSRRFRANLLGAPVS